MNNNTSIKTFPWRSLMPLLIFFILVSLLWRGLKMDPHHLVSPMLGKPVPQFELATVTESKNFSDKNLIGHVSLVNVWASWCEACRYEHPVLMDIALQHQVPIYAINYKDTATDAKTWLHDLGDPYQLVGLDLNGEVGINWGVYGTPETFVIDKKGRIRFRQTGPVTQAIWQQQLLPLIKKLEQETT